MGKSRTKKTDPKNPTVKPHTRGNMVKDRVTGNWSRIPDEPATVTKLDETEDASPPQA